MDNTPFSVIIKTTFNTWNKFWIPKQTIVGRSTQGTPLTLLRMENILSIIGKDRRQEKKLYVTPNLVTPQVPCDALNLRCCIINDESPRDSWLYGLLLAAKVSRWPSSAPLALFSTAKSISCYETCGSVCNFGCTQQDQAPAGSTMNSGIEIGIGIEFKPGSRDWYPGLRLGSGID